MHDTEAAWRIPELGEEREGFSFQEGRFQGESCEEAREVARYVHLNPVRIGRLGLGKAEAVRRFQVRLKD